MFRDFHLKNPLAPAPRVLPEKERESCEEMARIRDPEKFDQTVRQKLPRVLQAAGRSKGMQSVTGRRAAAAEIYEIFDTRNYLVAKVLGQEVSPLVVDRVSRWTFQTKDGQALQQLMLMHEINNVCRQMGRALPYPEADAKVLELDPQAKPTSLAPVTLTENILEGGAETLNLKNGDTVAALQKILADVQGMAAEAGVQGKELTGAAGENARYQATWFHRIASVIIDLLHGLKVNRFSQRAERAYDAIANLLQNGDPTGIASNPYRIIAGKAGPYISVDAPLKPEDKVAVQVFNCPPGKKFDPRNALSWADVPVVKLKSAGGGRRRADLPAEIAQGKDDKQYVRILVNGEPLADKRQGLPFYETAAQPTPDAAAAALTPLNLGHLFSRGLQLFHQTENVNNRQAIAMSLNRISEGLDRAAKQNPDLHLGDPSLHSYAKIGTVADRVRPAIEQIRAELAKEGVGVDPAPVQQGARWFHANLASEGPDRVSFSLDHNVSENRYADYLSTVTTTPYAGANGKVGPYVNVEGTFAPTDKVEVQIKNRPPTESFDPNDEKAWAAVPKVEVSSANGSSHRTARLPDALILSQTAQGADGHQRVSEYQQFVRILVNGQPKTDPIVPGRPYFEAHIQEDTGFKPQS